MSLLRHKQHLDDETQKLREQATALLEANNAPMVSARFQHLMAKVLYKLGEYRRALPFWEEAIGLAGEEIDSAMMAEMLHTMGECYCRIGLLDHATVPLRTALKIYRVSPEDIRLAAVLLSLATPCARVPPPRPKHATWKPQNWMLRGSSIGPRPRLGSILESFVRSRVVMPNRWSTMRGFCESANSLPVRHPPV